MPGWRVIFHRKNEPAALRVVGRGERSTDNRFPGIPHPEGVRREEGRNPFEDFFVLKPRLNNEEKTMSNEKRSGHFVWYDLMTSDPTGAQDFYSKLIGWEARPWEGGGEPYNLWTYGEKPLGGVLELPDEVRESGAPPHWLSYVGVADIKKTASRVT